MTKRRNILTGIVGALVMVVVVACAVIASPPRDLVAKNDHAALEAWYAKESAHLRQRAKDMIVMADEYQKNPGPSTRGVVPSKVDMVEHCQNLAAIYTKAAEEAEIMAKAHRNAMR